MTIDVAKLRAELRAAADRAALESQVAIKAGDHLESQFQTGRQAAFVTALARLTLREHEAAAERDRALEENITDEMLGVQAFRDGVIG